MALPSRELTNRKLLEELELNKKLLKQGVSALSTPASTPSPSSFSPDMQSLNSTQRSALNLAHTQSYGYYITQDSSFEQKMAYIKLKNLEQYLQEVNVFEKPKIDLEQYSTTPHLAACSLHTIQAVYGDIEGKFVADLGTGCGILGFGASLLGAAHTIGFEIDESALKVLRENMEKLEVTNFEVINCDIKCLDDKWNNVFDTVIMNPPFGTRKKGIDVFFVETSLKIANVVYSLHKTSTRKYLMKKSKEWGVKFKVVAELRLDLPSTYKFHTKSSVDINVDLIQFKRK